MDYTIEFVDKISPAEEDKMTRDFIAYERSHGVDVNYQRLSVVLKDSHGIAFGVLNAFTAFSEIYIDDLWIDTAHRGKGFGKKIVQALENRFKGKGFNNINLVTNAFNAPGFYEKCGFQAEFVRENKNNPKLNKTFFVKFFEDEVQTQGTLQTSVKKKSYPLIIGVSGISGAGKSSLIQRLANTLQSTTVFWDDYDDISQSPSDYVEWFHTSKNYSDWVYPKLEETLHQLKSGEIVDCPATKRMLIPTKYILFDAPLGYCHPSTGKYIDFLICLDTPPDIALARRLIRDYKHQPQKIIQELEEYLSKSRPLFLLSPDERNADFTIDGSLALEKQEEQILDVLIKR